MDLGLFILTVVCFFIFGAIFFGLHWENVMCVWMLMLLGGILGAIVLPITCHMFAWTLFGATGNAIRLGTLIGAIICPIIAVAYCMIADFITCRDTNLM